MRISQSRYRTLEAMSVDVHEMINNAKTFNQEGSAVYEDAEVLEREFEAALQRTRQELGLLAPPTGATEVRALSVHPALTLGPCTCVGGWAHARCVVHLFWGAWQSASGSGIKVSIKWNAGDGAKGGKAKSRGPARRPVSEENSDESAEDEDQEEEEEDDEDDDDGGNASARRRGGSRHRGADGGDSSDEEDEEEDEEEDDDDDGDSNSDEDVAASARRPVARGAQGRGAKAVPKPAGRASPSSKRRGAAARGRGAAPARRARGAASAPRVGRKRGRAEEEEEEDDDDDSTSGSEDGSSDAAPANDEEDDEDGSDDDDEDE